MGSYRANIKLWIIYAILGFPLFYFVYKFGSPDFGCRDFYDYYKLFKDMDISGVEAPFNMRLLGSGFVYLFYKLGFHYDTEIIFDAVGLDKNVFFSAVFFNYLCVVSTCVVIFQTIRRSISNIWLAFIGGTLYLLGFGTLFYEIMPITDALSILLFAVTFYYYLHNKYLIILPLLLLILQREYVFLALGLVALIDFWKLRSKYFLHVLFVCIGCFAIYFVLRKTVFYTPKYDHQASPGYFLQSIFKLQFPLLPYLKQVLITLNIAILYVLIIAYKKYKKMRYDGFALAKIAILFLQINIISFAAVFGNNTGRYFYMLVPMIIYYLITELSVFNEQ